MRSSRPRPSVTRLEIVLAALLAGIAVWRLATLGAYPLTEPSEARYAEIAREMFASGDWVTPRLEPGTPFWGKPPLSFWLTAASFDLLGVREFAARLPSFLCAALTVFVTMLLGRSLYGRTCGLLSGLVLASSGLFFLGAGLVLTDPALCATMTLAMAAVPLALRARSPRTRGRWLDLCFAALGTSLLAKGLEGPVLVLGALAVFAAVDPEQRPLLRGLPWLRGALLVLAIAVPWHVLQELRTPGFLSYYLVGEHLQRFVSGGWRGDLYGKPHEVPFGTIWLYLLISALPWTPVLLTRLASSRRRGLQALRGDPWALYLAISTLVPLTFFSIARSVLPTYVLPMLPPLAILTARALQLSRVPVGSGPPSHSPWAIAALALAVPSLATVYVVLGMPGAGKDFAQREIAARFLALAPDAAAELTYRHEMPHSADFYAGGRAVELPAFTKAAVVAELDDDDLDFFVIEAEEVGTFPHRGLSETVEVGTFGLYVLRRERPSHAAGLAGR